MKNAEHEQHYWVASTARELWNNGPVDAGKILGAFRTKKEAEASVTDWKIFDEDAKKLTAFIEKMPIRTLSDMADLINLLNDWPLWLEPMCTRMGWSVPDDDQVFVVGDGERIIINDYDEAVVRPVEK